MLTADSNLARSCSRRRNNAEECHWLFTYRPASQHRVARLADVKGSFRARRQPSPPGATRHDREPPPEWSTGSGIRHPPERATFPDRRCLRGHRQAAGAEKGAKLVFEPESFLVEG